MIKNLLGDNDRYVVDGEVEGPDIIPGGQQLSFLDPEPHTENEPKAKEKFILSTTEPESFSENTRRSGLAWSAGIVFFASVAFMLILGWGADLLFGSSPWGLVGGIVLGSLIGFIQFFRLTSQIFRQ